MSGYKPLTLEPEILAFWKEKEIYEKAKKKAKGKKFYFLDGPPYTSGKVHLGTAWNKSLKDSILRYKRMQGFKVIDRAGYDMHGLPTENAAEKELKLKGKHAIETFGVGKFTKACKELSVRNLKIMSKDFIRLGVWMDFDKAYQTISREYVDGEWWLVKKAHEQGRLYEGLRSMAWDWEHQTALAKHELEYKTVKDKSIFVKFPIKGKENHFFIIWTTTPWTIAFNLGIMVHPDLEYVRCKVNHEQWIVEKSLATAFISGVADKTFSIVGQVKGKELAGIEYVHPFYDELKEHYDAIKHRHPNAHTVVLTTEYVDTSSGTGLVHMAPGCGPEDYEVGHRNNIPAWNLVEENGVYADTMGVFSGRHALKDNHTFVEDLDKKGVLIAETAVEHEYPHGQRSHQPVIFRTTKQWFFKVEDIKKDIIKENNKVTWVPDAGYNAFNAWLENLRDNSISKQRYWGTPLPIWRNVDDPQDYLVVGSLKELEELSGTDVTEHHIPQIDTIVIEKDNKTYKRVPDVLDVWVDAGTASWNSLDYPENKEDFKKYFPADFILEGKDQIRGWFNLLMIASMVALKKPSFKAVYMHGFINDAQGRKMSKSLGNYILPGEVVERYGADTLRYYMIGGTQAGVDINYNFEDMKVKHKNLIILWNLHKFVIDLATHLKKNPKNIKIRKSDLDVEERYILSTLNSTIQKVTATLDAYKLNDVPWLIEDLFLELSRTYLQLTRDKINTPKAGVVLHTAARVLMEVIKMFSTIAPFISEQIYQNLKGAFGFKQESITLFPWPKHDEGLIDTTLERHVKTSQDIVQAGLAGREKLQRGVRWPLQELIVVTRDSTIKKAVISLNEIITLQLNVKTIKVKSRLPGIKQVVKADFKKLGPKFGELTPKIIAKIATDSPETVLRHIEEEGTYAVSVNGKKVNIVKDHLLVTRHLPPQYQEVPFNGGFIYLNRELTDELEAEGYAREITRRIQALRKKTGLERSDAISLFIRVHGELVDMLKDHESLIKDKVGATMLKISNLEPSKKHTHHVHEKIKGKQVELFLEKV